MSNLVQLKLDGELWEHVFQVAPLVMVGTREPDGTFDFAPKHKVVTLSPQHFGFVCRDSHATLRNARREQAFTVSWPSPRHIVMTSAAATPRCLDGEKKAMHAFKTVPATKVDGVLMEGCALNIECRLERVVEDLGADSFVIGRILAASADEEAVRSTKARDEEVVHEHPLLAYLHPSQFATIDKSVGYPFSKGFTRS